MKRYIRANSGVYFYAGFLIEHEQTGYQIYVNDTLVAGPFESAQVAEEWCDENEDEYF